MSRTHGGDNEYLCPGEECRSQGMTVTARSFAVKKTYLSGLALALATASGPFLYGQNYGYQGPNGYGPQQPAYNPYQLSNYGYQNQGGSLLQEQGHEHVPLPPSTAGQAASASTDPARLLWVVQHAANAHGSTNSDASANTNGWRIWNGQW